MRRHWALLALLAAPAAAQQGTWSPSIGAFGDFRWAPPAANAGALGAAAATGTVRVQLDVGEFRLWNGSAWVPIGGGGGGSVPDADATTKGILRLTNNLGGTADLPQVLSLAANGSNCDPGESAAGVDAAGNAEGCLASGSGDVVGPASATDGEILPSNGTSGKSLKTSGWVFTAAGGLTSPFVTGAGNKTLLLRGIYGGGEDILQIFETGNGKTAWVDSTSTWYLATTLSMRDGGLGLGKIHLAPAGGDKGLSFASDTCARWSSTSSATGTPDLKLCRDAAGVVKVQDLLELTPLASPPTCEDARVYFDTSGVLCTCFAGSWYGQPGMPGTCS